jgi:hypothetical protein
MREGKREGAFWLFWMRLGWLLGREEGLTDFLVGVGKPQLIFEW